MDEKKCDGTKTIFFFCMCIFVVEKSCGCAERIGVRERAVELDTERRECWRQTKASRRPIIMHQAAAATIQAVRSWGLRFFPGIPKCWWPATIGRNQCCWDTTAWWRRQWDSVAGTGWYYWSSLCLKTGRECWTRRRPIFLPIS